MSNQKILSVSKYSTKHRKYTAGIIVYHHRKMGPSHSVFPLRKFYTEHMVVLVRMRLRNHVDT